jgi:flavin reductase (DIM6/NTAB) family NADH-FMN oxidoreductase RutF
MATLTSFDSRQLRNVLGTFTTGVTVVTTRDPQGVPHGVTANSFSSVSLEPPLVLWSLALTSRSLAAFRDSDHFAVNVLAEDQVEVSKHFARPQDDKFASVNYTDGLGSVPVLEGTVAHFECVKVAAYPAGDHVIYLGRVERVSHSGRRPLAFSHGRYMVPVSHELGTSSAKAGGAAVASVDAVRIATDALPEISTQLRGETVGLAVWGNKGPTVIRWEQSGDAAVEARPGLVLSVTGTAAGLAFAAFLPGEVARAFVEEDLRLSRVADEDEQTQRQALEAAIADARRDGVARASDGLSVPVYDAHGNVIMAVSVLSRDAGSAKEMVEAGRRISRLIAESTRQTG